MNGVVTILNTVVDGSGDFVNDFTTVGAATKDQIPQTHTRPRAIYVRPGEETHEWMDDPDGWKAFFDIELDVYARDNSTTQDMVDQLEDVISDINLAINRNQTLGGACTKIELRTVDKAVFHANGTLAVVGITLGSEYFYESGSTT